MGFHTGVNYGGHAYDLARIPGPWTGEWADMEARILYEFRNRHSRIAMGKRLTVVHPDDWFLNEAVSALDRDDWDPELKMPYYTRYEAHYGGQWVVMELLPYMEQMRKRFGG